MMDPRLPAIKVLALLLRRMQIQLSFSQEGEDRILHRLFEDRPRGHYVDVGAHHPVRFSNTLLLYLRGWHGVNIDATPGSIRKFERMRPRDTNIESGVGLSSEPLDFYMFQESALNTFDRELAELRENSGWVLLETRAVDQQPLDAILSRVPDLPADFDLLTVDVEGRDLEVLQSMDWNRYRPKVVCLEKTPEGPTGSDPATYIRELGYRPCGRTAHSLLFAAEADEAKES
jgi:FkbM family methyltransferase